MADHFNALTPAEHERLALLLEELGEAQHAIGKILRHGYESQNPLSPSGTRNREMLERELGDVLAAVGLMTDASDISHGKVAKFTAAKLNKVGKYLHHQEQRRG